MAVYFVGDIQGCYSELDALLSQVAFSCQHDQLYVAGDLVARGPNSLETLRFISSLGSSAKVVLGNHDRLFRNFLDDPDWQDPGLRADLDWLDSRLGGDTTLESYGVANVAGAIVTTRMPCEANSRAAGRVKAATPPFEAA